MNIGEYLKQERVARQVSLNEIQSITKIPLRYLNDLEAGDLYKLPKVYIKGYIKSYTDCMDLQVPEGLLNVKELEIAIPTENPNTTPRKLSFGLNNKAIFIIIASLIVALAAFFATR